jgi:hypothetical protein
MNLKKIVYISVTLMAFEKLLYAQGGDAPQGSQPAQEQAKQGWNSYIPRMPSMPNVSRYASYLNLAPDPDFSNLEASNASSSNDDVQNSTNERDASQARDMPQGPQPAQEQVKQGWNSYIPRIPKVSKYASYFNPVPAPDFDDLPAASNASSSNNDAQSSANERDTSQADEDNTFMDRHLLSPLDRRLHRIGGELKDGKLLGHVGSAAFNEATKDANTAQAFKRLGEHIDKEVIARAKIVVQEGEDKGKSFLGGLKTTLRDGSRNVVLSAAAIFSLWYGTKLVWSHINQRIKESVVTFVSPNVGLFGWVKGWFGSRPSFEYRPLIFEKKIETMLAGICSATEETAKAIAAGDQQARYRNVLLSGPSGTGKTLFAKQFAYELLTRAGVSYIFLDGSFFAPSKNGEALQRVDLLFRKACECPKGALIFIDHAELLLAHRGTNEVSSEWHQIVTRFLSYIKEPSNKFMVIFATNRNFTMDEEVKSLVYEVRIGLPKHEESVQTLKTYRKVLLESATNSDEFKQSIQSYFGDDKINEVAQKLAGTSCRELENVVHLIAQDARVSGKITPEIIEQAVTQTKAKYAVLTAVNA